MPHPTPQPARPSASNSGPGIRSRWTWAVLGSCALAIGLGAASCTEAEPPVDPPVQDTPYPLPAEPPDLLSEWHLFTDLPTLTPSEGVQAFDVISPLFSDYSVKYRHLVVPEGTTIGYSDTEEWTFPVGTVLIKTFSYDLDARDPAAGRRILETRLLVRRDDGWVPHTYVWNDEQTDGERVRAGKVLDVAWIDDVGAAREIDYIVPNTNECRECHGEGETLDTLGGTSRNLDRDYDHGHGLENQIDRFDRLALFGEAPPAYEARVRLVDPFGEAGLSDRTRSYFDVNCAMCHRPSSAASESGLWLDWASTDPETGDPISWGICKIPTSAAGANCGRRYDVVPGHPEQSIMGCRVHSVDPQEAMPPLGRTLTHDEGAALIDAWITSLPLAGCETTE